MTRIAAVAMGFVGVCSNVFGGVVTFSPDSLEVPMGTGMVEVMVEFAPDPLGTGISLDAFDAVFGSARVPLAGFVFSDRITNPVGGFANFDITPNPGIGAYTNELYITANRGAPNDPPIPNLPVGTLSIDLSALELGDYSVLVDAVTDSGISQLLNRGVGDPLVGSLPIKIVPEPASVSLLALGALAALRFGRRRPAR